MEKYWEAGPSSVCIRCCSIGYERMRSCGDRSSKCIICAGLHKLKDHCCGVAGCNKEKGKICVHVTAICANYGRAYVANFPCCGSRHKAEIDAKKGKKTKKNGKKKEKMQACNIGNKVEEEEKEASPQ